MIVSSSVPPNFKQANIITYLATRFTYLSQETWLDLVEQQRITCNGVVCQSATLVSQGDIVTCDLPDFAPPPVNLAYSIVYEDRWLLGINKPGGLRVHSQGKFVTANLIYHLRYEHEPPYAEARLVNRLDADTSGVLLVARDEETRRLLGQQFAEQLVHKEYVAVVNGIPAKEEGTIDLPVGRAQGSKVKQRQWVVEGNGGKTAVSHYQLIAPLGSQHALLRLFPKSGRTHQLRVHLAAIGHPIVGDALYTMDDDTFLDWCQQRQPIPSMQGITRQALHCQLTRFTHPMTRQLCTIEAPLPDDMNQLIARLQAK
ncbi:MAG: RluA family pseudouridine synthase [Chloroflexota bacterium]